MVYTPEEISKTLLPLFKRYGIHRAALFGSYAKGTATENSDIDLFVDGGEFFTMRRQADLIHDVREATAKDVDLFDASQVTPGGRVDSEIQGTGVEIYVKHSDTELVKIILEHARHVLLYVKDITEFDFMENRMCRAAVTLEIQQMGEHTKRISADMKLRHKHIPWRLIAGIRDVISHEYQGLDFGRIWELSNVEIPELIDNLEEILKETPQ